MSEKKIRISNERLWDIARSGEDIDAWLREKVGTGNWMEWFGLSNLPYRSFSFTDDKHYVLFALTWL